jgi:hypothetical protein
MQSLARACAVMLVLAPCVVSAAPRHDVCADIGSTIGFGTSSFGSADGWLEAAQSDGATWKLVYAYLQPNWNDGLASFVALKAGVAKDVHSMLVLTLYNLLARGKAANLAGCGGSEADCVKAVLQAPDLMKGYFDGFIGLLGAAQSAIDGGVPAMVHVEPDSWGFMMWAMGTDGQTDASKVLVQVKSSGHPDVQDFSDDAGGFGRALVHLRDKYAPAVRLGWHASNFRAGTRPEVVSSFFSSMGDWDAIVSESPHILKDKVQWWNGLDPALVDANMSWLTQVSATAKLPVLLWQQDIGPLEYYWFVDAGGPALLGRFLGAGVAGIMWDHQCHSCSDPSNPDTFRGTSDDVNQFPAPPASFGSGDAEDLRIDLTAYEQHPIGWPAGSICATGAATGGPVGSGGGGNGTSSGSGADTSAIPMGGSGCTMGGRSGAEALPWVLLVLVWRRRQHPSRA